MLKIALVGAALLASVALTTTADTGSPNNPALVIDVRTPEEYRTGHVPGALNIPYQEIGPRITTLAPNRETRIWLYCRSGRRSAIATQTLRDLGYHQVENQGGLANVMPNGGYTP